MSLKGNEWKKKFIAANTVNEKCAILDQTSNTVFNTLTTDIISGFFTFGAGWLNAISRAFSNWWGNAKRYKNLKALWADATDTTNDMQAQINTACKNLNIEDRNTINLIKNCIRLTLALCARTYQKVDERGRWSRTVREIAYDALRYTKIKTNSGEKQWFDFLVTNIPDINGMMSEFLTAQDAKDLRENLAKRYNCAESVINAEHIVTSKENFHNDKNAAPVTINPESPDKDIQEKQK